MASKTKPFAIAGAAMAILVIGGAAAVGLSLALPGTPSTARHVKFMGYIKLPTSRRQAVSVLDYLSVSDGRLFVAGESSGSVYKVSLTGSRLPGEADVSVFSGPPSPHGVAIDPETRIGYVTRSDLNTVDAFDPSTMALLGHISVPDDPDGIFYDPAHRLIYAVSGDSHAASIIDPRSRTKVGEIDLGGKPEFAAFDPKTGMMLQNLADRNALAIVDLGRRVVVQRQPLDRCESPSGMALDAQNRRLFIVCSGNATLVVVDIDQLKTIATMRIGKNPDAVDFDRTMHRIYATGRGGVMSVIQQISPDSYQVIDRVHMHYGAHTLAVDQASHQIYVGYASLIVSPRIAVFAPEP